jgi:hypothetical protein
MTPEKTAIEIKIAQEITNRLKNQDRTKYWLSNKLGMDYGKVKRVLSLKDNQQLSLSVAENMLSVLGSNLPDAMLRHVIRSIREDIDKGLAKYDVK